MNDYMVAGYFVCGVWLQPPQQSAVLVSDALGIQAVPVYRAGTPWRWIITSGNSVVSRSWRGFVQILGGVRPDLWAVEDTSFSSLDDLLAWWHGEHGQRMRAAFDRARSEAKYRGRERLRNFWEWPGALN